MEPIGAAAAVSDEVAYLQIGTNPRCESQVVAALARCRGCGQIFVG